MDNLFDAFQFFRLHFGGFVQQDNVTKFDLLYDEIGSVLKVKQLQNTKQELLESLEMYYKVTHQINVEN